MLYIIIASAIVIIISYLVGSNMAAVRIAASRGTDINKVGSGNAGSTNILRTFGWRWGLICLAFDAAKGAFSVLTGYLVGLLFSHLGLVSADICIDLMCLGVLGAMAGHLLPIFHGFRGGKCVAVATGGMLVLFPVPCIISFAVAALLIIITKMMSVGSVIGVLLCAALVIISEWGNAAVCIMAATVALVICIAHIPNIRRILEGNERKLENLAWDKASKKKQQKQK